MADLEAFDDKMEEVEKDFLNKDIWTQKAILNVARIGKFTSDRAVMEYAKNIWNTSPCGPEQKSKKTNRKIATPKCMSA